LTDVPFQTASVDHNLHNSSAASGAVDAVADCVQAFDQQIESVNIALQVGVTTNCRGAKLATSIEVIDQWIVNNE
jgi:hypothetical protein